MFTCLKWDCKGKSGPFPFSDFMVQKGRGQVKKYILALKQKVLVMRQSKLNGEALKDGVACRDQ